MLNVMIIICFIMFVIILAFSIRWFPLCSRLDIINELNGSFGPRAICSLSLLKINLIFTVNSVNIDIASNITSD